MAILLDRLPAKLGQTLQQCANAVFAFIGDGTQTVGVEDEFFVLGADQPVFTRLFPAGDILDQLGFGLDGLDVRFSRRGHADEGSQKKKKKEVKTSGRLAHASRRGSPDSRTRRR